MGDCVASEYFLVGDTICNSWQKTESKRKQGIMTDNKQELFPITDEKGNILGKITRGEAHGGGKVLHPVVHLHVFNSHGDLFLQQRPIWKDIQPGKWDTAVGGHINYEECLDDKGNQRPTLEGCIENALAREAREELGISGFTPHFLGTYVFEGVREREQVFCFSTVYDKEIIPDKEELAGGRFWSEKEILDAIGKGLFTPNFEDEYIRVVKR